MVTDELRTGQKLRAAREMQVISLVDVSRDTKITVASLKCLEDENLSDLPGGVNTRSIIKTYCVSLGLDPKEIGDEFSERYPDEVGREITFEDVNVAPADEYHSEQAMARTVVLVAGLSIPCLAFVAYLSFADNPETNERIETVESEAETTNLSVVEENVRLERTFDAEQVVSSNQELVIELAPQADCWVSADVDGVESLSKLMRPGDRETIRFTDRAILNVGDAGALSLKINDRLAKSLGGNGEVVTATIDRTNYQSYFLDE